MLCTGSVLALASRWRQSSIAIGDTFAMRQKIPPLPATFPLIPKLLSNVLDTGLEFSGMDTTWISLAAGFASSRQ
jgi:hypothetical protein